MSTELVGLSCDSYLALSAESESIREAMDANLGCGSALRESDLTRVPTPSGGGTAWSIPTIGDDEIAKTIEGILVFQGPRGVLWAGDSPQEGSLPVLVTHDLKTAHRVSQEISEKMLDDMAVALNEDGTYDWELLPQNVWGSGRGGTGKGVKEQRVLYVLRANDVLPMVIVIQPGSLKHWQQFMLGLVRAGVPFYRAIVRLTLEKTTSAAGEPYSRIVPTLAGTLTREQGIVVREKFSKPMAALAARAFMG